MVVSAIEVVVVVDEWKWILRQGLSNNSDIACGSATTKARCGCSWSNETYDSWTTVVTRLFLPSIAMLRRAEDQDETGAQNPLSERELKKQMKRMKKVSICT